MVTTYCGFSQPKDSDFDFAVLTTDSKLLTTIRANIFGHSSPPTYVMKRTLLMLVPFFVVSRVFAMDVVTNGSFENTSPVTWVTNYNNIIGNWGAPGTSGRSLSLSAGGTAGSYAFEAVNLQGYSSALLSFDLTVIKNGAAESSYFTANLGYDNELTRYRIGEEADGTVTTKHYSILVTNPVAFQNLSPLLFAGSNPMGSSTEFYVDNVVLDASAVPEPATMFVLGGGLVMLMRRRKSR